MQAEAQICSSFDEQGIRHLVSLCKDCINVPVRKGMPAGEGAFHGACRRADMMKLAHETTEQGKEVFPFRIQGDKHTK